MCYDISFKVEIRQISDYIPDVVFDSRVNIDFVGAAHVMGHAYGEHPVIYIPTNEITPHCRLMEWGCIPYYVKDEGSFKKMRPSMLNARSERILEDTKSYWYKIRSKRCLMPVTGIYEHREVSGWKKKVPYFIWLKDQPLFFIPGLYSVTELPDTETGELVKKWTYTIITRAANDVMKMIHNGGDNKWRMPLFLPNEMAMKWLQADLSPEDYKAILDYEMPSEALGYHTVDSVRARSGREDGKEKNEAFEWAGLPGLSLEA